ncbi:MAG: riboflavin synthase [Kiritimatiellae bacterium]|nr:riboflavin synthase [Kiritimatiellia bacterium]
MFTGIIQHIGIVENVEDNGSHGRLRVRAARWEPALVPGESIAVEGVCLTVTGENDGVMTFDVLKETFDRTNFGKRKAGQRLNLERALRVGDALGGHFVSGHVDGVGQVRSTSPVGRDKILEVTCADDLLAQMIVKGSIAISGVSLTLVDLKSDAFTVHLIPHTWENTSLSELTPGDAVNLETDMLGKYVQRFNALRR